MGSSKIALSMHIDSEETFDNYSQPFIDVNNKHVIPVLWTAILHAYDFLFEKDKFEFVHLTSHLYGELLSDLGYHDLVFRLKSYVHTEGEELPLFLVYDPIDNTRHVVYVMWDLTPMLMNVGVKKIFPVDVIRYGKTEPDTLYLPLRWEEFRPRNILFEGDDTFKIRGKLMNTFFRYAPFGIYPFPSSFDKSMFGLNKRPEIEFTKSGRVKDTLDRKLEAEFRSQGWDTRDLQ